MEDSKKHFYVKFKMDSELHVMENMIISESRSTIDEWKAARSEEQKPEDDEKKEHPTHSGKLLEISSHQSTLSRGQFRSLCRPCH
jgi:hypothetical protein